MSLVLALSLALAAAFVFFRMRGHSAPRADITDETTPELDAFLAEALEHELAGPALGLRGASADERRPLARTLRGEPDPDVVARIEEKVKGVELEFVRFAHEQSTEVTVRVRYEDGGMGETSKRLVWAGVPASVRRDFEGRGGTRVFRRWTFSWQRVQAL